MSLGCRTRTENAENIAFACVGKDFWSHTVHIFAKPVVQGVHLEQVMNLDIQTWRWQETSPTKNKSKLLGNLDFENRMDTASLIIWKVRQYVVNREWRGNIRAGQRRNHFRSASVIILLLTSSKKYSQPKKIAQRIELLTKFAHNEQVYCEQKFAQ
jgi:hypothetical protein